MGKNRLWIGFAIVALGGIAVVVATKLTKADLAALSDEKAVPAAPALTGAQGQAQAQPQAGIAPTQGGAPPQVPANLRDADKLTALQSEVTKFSDEQIESEILLVKKKVQELGLIKPGEQKNIDFNANPEAKALLTRMGLLRVEKAKRERAQAQAATAKQDL